MQLHKNGARDSHLYGFELLAEVMKKTVAEIPRKASLSFVQLLLINGAFRGYSSCLRFTTIQHVITLFAFCRNMPFPKITA